MPAMSDLERRVREQNETLFRNLQQLGEPKWTGDPDKDDAIANQYLLSDDELRDVSLERYFYNLAILRQLTENTPLYTKLAERFQQFNFSAVITASFKVRDETLPWGNFALAIRKQSSLPRSLQSSNFNTPEASDEESSDEAFPVENIPANTVSAETITDTPLVDTETATPSVNAVKDTSTLPEPKINAVLNYLGHGADVWSDLRRHDQQLDISANRFKAGVRKEASRIGEASRTTLVGNGQILFGIFSLSVWALKSGFYSTLITLGAAAKAAIIILRGEIRMLAYSSVMLLKFPYDVLKNTFDAILALTGKEFSRAEEVLQDWSINPSQWLHDSQLRYWHDRVHQSAVGRRFSLLPLAFDFLALHLDELYEIADLFTDAGKKAVSNVLEDARQPIQTTTEGAKNTLQGVSQLSLGTVVSASSPLVRSAVTAYKMRAQQNGGVVEALVSRAEDPAAAQTPTVTA